MFPCCCQAMEHYMFPRCGQVVWYCALLLQGQRRGTQKFLSIFVIEKTKQNIMVRLAQYKHIIYDILFRRGCLSTSAWCPAPHRVVSLSQCVAHTTDTRPHFTNSADFSHEHAGNFLCASLHAYTILNGNDCISRAPVRVSRPSLPQAYIIYHTELSWTTGPNLD